jgi:dTDP-4-dehydrorhamnose reductase
VKVVVLGESGQVARHLCRILPGAIFWGRASVDASDASRLQAALLATRPTAIINAAAFTAVDLAETQQDMAWRLNTEAPAAAARAAGELDIPLVHISTDYVFDGESHAPYTESDAVNPLNVYGRTKLAGELAVSTLCRKHWILRTSWVFSEYGQNFVTTMVRLASGRNVIDVVSDQFGRPTYAGDLAALIGALVAGDNQSAIAPGIYHAAGGPVVSWYKFATLIFRHSTEIGVVGKAPEIRPILTTDYPTDTKRPLRAVLETSSSLARLVENHFDYDAGLRATLRSLARVESRSQPAT